MNSRWGGGVAMAFVLGLALVGCRTPQANVKPDKQADVFNVPPASITNNNNYPKQAFNDPDAPKRPSLDPGKIMPAGGGPSMSGPASFGGPGGGGVR